LISIYNLVLGLGLGLDTYGLGLGLGLGGSDLDSITAETFSSSDFYGTSKFCSKCIMSLFLARQV